MNIGCRVETKDMGKIRQHETSRSGIFRFAGSQDHGRLNKR
jgi:hypothetical protein